MVSSVSAFCSVVASVLVVAFAVVRRKKRQPKGFPTGPPAWPILGNLLDLAADAPKALHDWSLQYGKTMAVQLGMTPMIVINDFDTAKQVFSDDNGSKRPPQDLTNYATKGHGLFNSPHWRDLRRFTLSTLRDGGMGKTSMEGAVLEEIANFFNWLNTKKGLSMDPRRRIAQGVSNITCSLLFGKDFQHSDDKFTPLCDGITDYLFYVRQLVPVVLFPVLRYLPFTRFPSMWEKFMLAAGKVVDFCKALINVHLFANDTKGESYVSKFFIEQRNHPNQAAFTEEELQYTLFGLLLAGTETTATSLLWGFVYMCNHPRAMRKVQAELDANVPMDQSFVRMEHKSSLPYTEATLQEIQRLASVVPLVHHSTVGSMDIDGCTIPAGTLVVANTYAIHRDPILWEDPQQFIPERFLDGENKVLSPKGFMPFSIGKRACPGEALAKMELYLFFVNILRTYDIVVAPNSREDVRCERNNVGTMRVPVPFDLQFIRRTRGRLPTL